MKKVISLFLALVLCLSLCACNHNNDVDLPSTDNQLATFYPSEDATETTKKDIEAPNMLLGTWYDHEDDAILSFSDDGSGLLTEFDYVGRDSDGQLYGVGEYEQYEFTYYIPREGEIVMSSADSPDYVKTYPYQIVDNSLVMKPKNLAYSLSFKKARSTTSIVGAWELFSNYDDRNLLIDGVAVGMNNLIIYSDGTYEMGQTLSNMYSGTYSLIHDGKTINLYDGYFPSSDINLDISFLAEGLMELSFPGGNNSIMFIAPL